MIARFEPVADGELAESFEDMVKKVRFQVNCVLQENGKSVYTGFQRFFHSM